MICTKPYNCCRCSYFDTFWIHFQAHEKQTEMWCLVLPKRATLEKQTFSLQRATLEKTNKQTNKAVKCWYSSYTLTNSYQTDMTYSAKRPPANEPVLDSLSFPSVYPAQPLSSDPFCVICTFKTSCTGPAALHHLSDILAAWLETKNTYSAGNPCRLMRLLYRTLDRGLSLNVVAKNLRRKISSDCILFASGRFTSILHTGVQRFKEWCSVWCPLVADMVQIYTFCVGPKCTICCPWSIPLYKWIR